MSVNNPFQQFQSIAQSLMAAKPTVQPAPAAPSQLLPWADNRSLPGRTAAATATQAPAKPGDTQAKQNIMEGVSARHVPRYADYTASAAQPTFGFMAFPPVERGRIQEFLYLTVYQTDPFTAPAGASALAFISTTLPQDGSIEPTFANLISSAQLTATTAAVNTYIESSNTGAAAAINATLNGVAGATTWISGFSVTGSGATAASVIVVTLSGIQTLMSFELVIPAGITTSITPLVVEFVTPIPSSALNTNIVVSVPSFGAGNTNAGVNAHGYTQVAASTSAAGNFPFVVTPSRRQKYLHENERVIVCFKNLPNSTKMQGVLDVIDYDYSTWLASILPS